MIIYQDFFIVFFYINEGIIYSYINCRPKNISYNNNHIYFYCEVSKKTVFDLIFHLREAEEKCFITAYKLNIPDFM
jgi:hypothetical protein